MSTATRHTPVLIVGAGPVGLALALDLGQRGVPSLVIDRKPVGADTLPWKAGTLNERTMELCRRWGISEQVAHWGAPDDYPRDTVYCTSLIGGYFLGRSRVPSTEERRALPETPEIPRKCPQFILDPLLARAALETGLVQLQYGTALTGLTQSPSGVTVEVVTDDGVRHQITADYLVGCDGAGSKVRRLLEIPFEGHTLDYSLTVVAEIDSLERYHDYGRAERFMFVGTNGTWCNVTSMDFRRYWRFTFLGYTEEPDPASFDAEAAVARAVGDGEIPFNILGVTPWRRSQCTARRFHKGRVLLAGDAAHTTSPTGGHGLNTGLGDVSDLGWMLSACIHGWGGPGLLRAYTTERRQVAVRNGAISSRNYEAWVGAAADYDRIFDSGPEGDAVRARIGRHCVEALYGEWHAAGVSLGYRYEGSPIIVPDGTPAPPDPVSTYTQTARPGHRAPHIVLPDGSSTLDMFGDEFVLLGFASASSQTDQLRSAAKKAHVPLRVVTLSDDHAEQVYASPLVLVRPDGHVAWRATSSLDTKMSEEIIDTVRGAARHSEGYSCSADPLPSSYPDAVDKCGENAVDSGDLVF